MGWEERRGEERLLGGCFASDEKSTVPEQALLQQEEEGA